eukprot:440572_1
MCSIKSAIKANVNGNLTQYTFLLINIAWMVLILFVSKMILFKYNETLYMILLVLVIFSNDNILIYTSMVIIHLLIRSYILMEILQMFIHISVCTVLLYSCCVIVLSCIALDNSSSIKVLLWSPLSSLHLMATTDSIRTREQAFIIKIHHYNDYLNIQINFRVNICNPLSIRK